MTKKCRICGRTYPDEAAFCGKCGVPLVEIEDTGKESKSPINKSTNKPGKPRKTQEEKKDAAWGQTEALLDELNSMIGLSSVKEEVQNRINMIRVARKAAELGSGRVFSVGTLHMVFTGNPGTGKTTVARLLGKIYGALGVLKNPDVFIECGRNDLVAGFIGQTAPLVKKKFDEARGGVLFIDEAYSLYNPALPSDFGQEAIDTMVQYMDTMRDEVMVVVAGYKKEMEIFIRDANPGLASRFKTVINFEDYSPSELFEILMSMIRKDGMKLEDDAVKYVKKVIQVRSKNTNFGNARGVRNLFEDIKEAHDTRLGEMISRGVALNSNMIDCITAEDVKSLLKNHDEEDLNMDDLLAQLDELVGLRAVKQQLKQQIAIVQAQKNAVKAGVTNLKEIGPQHMIFAGNPGTGKTTVARLVGKIYEVLGLVADSSIFVECGRSDLVGEYLGQTAPKVDKMVRSALGGILFIDEAYSLYQDDSATTADYGKEAINELVKEIENHRDNLIVIMAGYTQEMKNMIGKANPGLKSRFPVWLEFEDYTAAEMVQIFYFMLQEKGYRMAGEPGDLEALVEKASKEPNFGNARGVRNLVDKVISAQSLRLSEIGYENIHDPDMYVKIESSDLMAVMEKIYI